MPVDAVDAALADGAEGWRNEPPALRESFDQFGDRLPAALVEELARPRHLTTRRYARPQIR